MNNLSRIRRRRNHTWQWLGAGVLVIVAGVAVLLAYTQIAMICVEALRFPLMPLGG
jgi:hypothetical protein